MRFLKGREFFYTSWYTTDQAVLGIDSQKKKLQLIYNGGNFLYVF